MAGAVLAVTATITACSTETYGPPVSVAPVVAHGQVAFPDGAVNDWATYADYLLQVKATGERRLPPDQEDVKRGEGVILRKVDLQAEKVLWQRPTLRSDIRAPETITIGTGGWLFHDGEKERPLVFEGQQPLEIGKTYVAVMTFTDLSGTGPEWITTQILPVVGSTVQAPQAEGFRAQEVVGQSVESLGRILNQAEIDPLAKPYMDLDPWDRRMRVLKDSDEPPQKPGPGEK